MIVPSSKLLSPKLSQPLSTLCRSSEIFSGAAPGRRTITQNRIDCEIRFAKCHLNSLSDLSVGPRPALIHLWPSPCCRLSSRGGMHNTC